MSAPEKIILYDSDTIRIQYVKEYIDQNIQRDLSIKSLSRKFAISVSTLQRHFYYCLDEPISIYIRRKRMSLAMELLTAHLMPIGEIGLAVGYDDRSTFTHAFTDFYHHPPAYFLRGGQQILDLT